MQDEIKVHNDHPKQVQIKEDEGVITLEVGGEVVASSKYNVTDLLLFEAMKCLMLINRRQEQELQRVAAARTRQNLENAGLLTPGRA